MFAFYRKYPNISKRTGLEVLVLGLLLLFFCFGPFYSGYLLKYTKYTLVLLYGMYVLIVLPYLIFRKNGRTYFRLFEVIQLLTVYVRKFFLKEKIKTDKKARLFALSFLVKLYFIPVMLDYSLWMLKLIWNNDFYQNFSIDYLSNGYQWFFTITQIIFLLDLGIYTFAYVVESGKLGNKIKSVDKSLTGWFFALICYHPFSLFMYLFVTSPEDEFYFINDQLTTILYLLVLTFYSLDLLATIYLGFKCGNLVNRGIVTTGPYRVIRHPSYIVKILVLWALTLPVPKTEVIVSSFIWSFVYIMRVVTEERHLKQDSEYIEYMKKTRFRLIPFIY